MRRYAWIACLLAVPGLMGGGCPGAPDCGLDSLSDCGQPPEGDNAHKDQPGGPKEPADLFNGCGTRTVATIPGPGFIETSYDEYQMTVDPPDSPLAKTLFGFWACQQMDMDDDDTMTMLEEIDAGGHVLAHYALTEQSGTKYYTKSTPFFPQQYVIKDGCLDIDITLPTSQPATQPVVSPLDPTSVPKGPCGDGQIAIDRNGQVTYAPDGPYVCVKMENASFCRDCWYGDNAWHQRVSMTADYVALGSLEGISIREYAQSCGQDVTSVNIVAGDRIRITFKMTSTHRMSPSPTELGYVSLLANTTWNTGTTTTIADALTDVDDSWTQILDGSIELWDANPALGEPE